MPTQRIRCARALFSFALFASAVGAGCPARAATFTDSHGYQISTPNGWIKKLGPRDGKYAAVFYCGTGRNGLPSLPMVEIATRPQEAMTMKKLASLGPWIVSGTFPGFRPTSATTRTLGGVPALDLRGTYPRDGRTICVQELFAIRAGEAYFITSAYPAEERALCASCSERVIASLRWR